MKKLFITVLILFTIYNGNFAQRNKMRVEGNVAVSIPMGDFNDVASMGFGLNGTFLYSLSKVFDISGSLGYISWGKDQVEIDNTTIGTIESTTTIPVLTGIRYYFPQRNLKPYASIDFGMNIFFSASRETKKGDTFVYFGYALGGGAVYEISDGINLDGSLKYNNIGENPYKEKDNGSLAHITLQVGVSFVIN